MLSANQNSSFKNKNRINKLLSLIEKEAEAPPTYYVIDKLSKKLGLPAPSNKAFLQKLANSGFKAVPTHFNPRGIKTTASSLQMQQLLKQTITSPITPELKTDQE